MSPIKPNTDEARLIIDAAMNKPEDCIIHISVSEQFQGPDSTGRIWRWEVSPVIRCPWPLRGDGEPFKRLPSERSRFWEAVELREKGCIDEKGSGE